MQLTFVGCGDAFASGGRLNTCFHVTGESVNFLVDCGASSLVGLKSRRVALNDIQAIFVTHFHADHFGGIPFFMLDAQFFSRRTRPLIVAGPAGLRDAYERVMEVAFKGSAHNQPKFELSLVELAAGQRADIAGVAVLPFQAVHGPAGGPFFSYRLQAEGRSLAYTGDTEWNEQLIPAAAGVDLLVAEAYFFERKVKFHLDLQSLARQLPAIAPKRLILTHMSDDMLARAGALPYELAFDGKSVDF